MADTTLRARVAMVFQQPNPFPMSIFDNVAFALREQSRKRPRRRELEPLVVDALQRAGLYEEVRDDLDRPRCACPAASSSACASRARSRRRPEVLLMDEPCRALDPISTATIEKLIGELRRDLAVVVVTHNLAQAHRIADKVAFMYLGDLVEYGTTADVFDHPRATRTREYVRRSVRMSRARPSPPAMRPGLLRRGARRGRLRSADRDVAACESTESESAKIAREAGAAEITKTLKLGAANRDVRVSHVALISGGGRKAVAVKLTSSAARAQQEVPLLVQATGAGGKVVYSNATGAEALLSHVTLLPAHASVWWVDDELLTSGTASAAKVRVGTGRRSAPGARSAALSAKTTHVAAEAGTTTVSGVVANHTGKAQSSVPVFAVATRDGNVVAAGRAVVASVPAHASAAPSFNVPLVGDATGAKIVLTALPGAAVAGGGLR